MRSCALCHKFGDYLIRGRLIPVYTDSWVHTVCGFWSAEVSLDENKLKNIKSAIERGVKQQCSFCRETGATLGCSVLSCQNNYHPICGLLSNCYFNKMDHDKYLLCYKHAYAMELDNPDNSAYISPPQGHLAINRNIDIGCIIPSKIYQHIFQTDRSYFQFNTKILSEDNNDFQINSKRKRATSSRGAVGEQKSTEKGKGEKFDSYFIRVGALTVYSLGNIEKSPYFHNQNTIFPVGYKAKRIYWCYRISPSSTSTNSKSNQNQGRKYRRYQYSKQTRRKCIYTLEIMTNLTNERPLFSILADNDLENPIRSFNINDVYNELLKRINNSKIHPNQIPLHSSSNIPTLCGEFFFGLKWPGIMDIIEKLPNANYLPQYKYRSTNYCYFPRNVVIAALDNTPMNLYEYKLPETINSSSRTNVHNRMSSIDKLRYLDAFINNPCNAKMISAPKKNNLSLGLINNFLISSLDTEYKLMQIKNKLEARLQVLRSKIHGWGLYATKPIKKGEMIIEYVGEVIPAKLEDIREKKYEKLGYGCYMFRIPDEEQTIDATMKGNIARFINHSCQPNAKTDHIIINNHKKIIIFATKDINPGEEIYYNYMLNDDGKEKVLCNCGSPSCSGYIANH